MIYYNLYLGLAWILTVGLAFVEVRALIDAITRKPRDFLVAGKRSQQFWLLLLGGALLLGLTGMPILRGGSLFLSMLCVVPAGVYLTDVAPELPSRRRRS